MPLDKKTNPGLVELVQDLRKASWVNEAPIWRDIAVRLSKRTKARVEVNVSHIGRNLRDGEIALVPGKLLAAGSVTKKMDVAALSFSQAARAKVTAAGGKCFTIRELMNENPKGAMVRIVG